MNVQIKTIDHKALSLAKEYKRQEYLLIEILQQVETHRVFAEFGHYSLFDYATSRLKLSRDVAYNLITIGPGTKNQLSRNYGTFQNRTPIPQGIKHKVILRDHGRCQFKVKADSICSSKRWIDLHHKIPLSQGGNHSVDNIVTLCRFHHQRWHTLQSQKHFEREHLMLKLF